MMDAQSPMEGGPTEGPQMSQEEAMAVLQQFKIPPDAIPQVMAACETLEYAQQAPQQQSAPSPSLMQALSSRYQEPKQ